MPATQLTHYAMWFTRRDRDQPASSGLEVVPKFVMGVAAALGIHVIEA